MQKQKTKNNQLHIKRMLTRLSTIQRTGVALSLAVLITVGTVVPHARADQYQEQINALQSQNQNLSNNVDQLGAEAESLQDQIRKLQDQINVLQAQIVANQAKRDDLQRQIVEAEAELDRQKKVLGENIKMMYLEGQISTLEMLASSKDLSEFVDKQQYRDSVQAKIKTTLDKINDLKLKLKDQKAETEGLLRDQENMRGQVAAQQAEQNRILSLNQAQQAELDRKIKENRSQISTLRAQQAAANARLGGTVVSQGSCGGGYPAVARNAFGANWGCSYPLDNTIDNWGMYNRECVSYTAWKVYQTYGYMPYWGGRGNANEWPSSARTDGIPTGTTPRANSVAISMNGYYGHAMWVEAVVDGGNSVYVSQYNYDLRGNYSEMKISARNLIYIYFN